MKKILFLLLAFPFCVNAQKKRQTVNERLFTENKTAISFNPFALAAIDYTLLAGYERKLSHKLFLGTEAGYIFASGYIGNDGQSSNNGTGFIIRPSLRWFVADNNKFYLQPQVFYKQVTHKMHDWLGKDAVNGVPSYEQLQDFKYRRKISGFNLVAGFALPLGQHKRRYIDLYFGLGIRNKRSLIAGEPTSIYNRTIGIFEPVDDGVFPSVPVGVRFIYAID
jgi:hypothetical protein